MATVFLALGSNVGDSGEYLERAITSLAEKIAAIQRAPIYKTKPMGFTDQSSFSNTAIKGQTALDPADLLDFIKSIEQQLGRIKTFRWGPREIDIDIIFYEDLKLVSPELTIPHPEFWKRDFVLQPLVAIDPLLRDPQTNVLLSELLHNIPPDERYMLTS